MTRAHTRVAEWFAFVLAPYRRDETVTAPLYGGKAGIAPADLSPETGTGAEIERGDPAGGGAGFVLLQREMIEVHQHAGEVWGGGFLLKA
ncbi:MAG: hypothetical protein NTY53_17970, partial [Kiritimatiellaeota bacterium]|nr:hypothetical protein [Kiritimatiellota bacterium]